MKPSIAHHDVHFNIAYLAYFNPADCVANACAHSPLDRASMIEAGSALACGDIFSEPAPVVGDNRASVADGAGRAGCRRCGWRWAGVGLVWWELRLTKFKKSAAGYFYTPNAHIGIALSLLLVARLGYRFF